MSFSFSNLNLIKENFRKFFWIPLLSYRSDISNAMKFLFAPYFQILRVSLHKPFYDGDIIPMFFLLSMGISYTRNFPFYKVFLFIFTHYCFEISAINSTFLALYSFKTHFVLRLPSKVYTKYRCGVDSAKSSVSIPKNVHFFYSPLV